MPVGRPEQLTGRFSGHLADVLLVFGDESFFAGDPKVRGILFHLITEATVLAEAKFRDAFQLKNMRAFIFASNDVHVVPAGRKSRRFTVLKIDESHIGDPKYFAAIKAELANGGREEMIRYLVQEKFDDVDPYKAWQTAALTEQKELSFDNPTRYWFDLLCRAELPQTMRANGAPKQTWDDKHTTAVTVDEIMIDYMAQPYMVRTHANETRAAETALGICLKNLIPSARKTRRMCKDVRAYYWELPPLKIARAEFDRANAFQYEWETSRPSSKKPRRTK
jgi:hypothetical protein